MSLKTKAVACVTFINLSKFLPESCIKINVKNVLFAVTQVARMFYPTAEMDFPDTKLSKSKDVINLYPTAPKAMKMINNISRVWKFPLANINEVNSVE